MILFLKEFLFLEKYSNILDKIISGIVFRTKVIKDIDEIRLVIK
jgi:hypothetical protein